jgi:hypothetical protein
MTANEPQLVQFEKDAPALTTTITAFISTGQTGATCDAGIYGPVTAGSTTATLFAHTGSKTCVSSGYTVTATLGTPVTWPGGIGYIGVCSSVTAVIFGTQGATGGWNSIPATDNLSGTDSAGADNCAAGVLPASITIANIGGANISTPAIYITN